MMFRNCEWYKKTNFANKREANARQNTENVQMSVETGLVSVYSASAKLTGTVQYTSS